MLKSILKASVYIACLAGSGIAWAASLGGINVTSSLGQPLKAEIDVSTVDKADKSKLRAKLASASDYKNAGIDYPFGIPKLKFQIEDRENGSSYIKVTSTQPVNEPFVTLMVELSWSSGKLLREYTFLLDPVDYKPLQPKQEEVKPIEPVLAEPVVELAPVAIAEPAASAPAAAESLEATPVTPAVEAAPVVVPTPESDVGAAPSAEKAVEPAPVSQSAVAAEPVLEAAPAEKPLTEQPLAQEPETAAAPMEQDALSKEESMAEPAPNASSGNIAVVRGDTLSKIAAQIKPANVSLERMLVALYRENAGVFDGHNMNRIRAGKILTIPQSSAAEMLPQADAEEEIRAQAADWNVYRQKLGAVSAPRVEKEDKQEASGRISAAVTDKALPSKETAKEVLKLSKGEAPNDKAVSGGKSSAQEKDIAKEEEAIAKSKALKEAQERTAILEKNLQDAKRLEELKKEPAPVSASAPAPVVAMHAASAAQAASSVAAAKPKPQVVPPKAVVQPSLIDQLLGNPIYLGVAAALVLVLGGLGFKAARGGKGGGKKTASRKDDIGSSTGRIAAPVAPSPETGDFTHVASQPVAVASADVEEVDPIGEADLFLTFGRDAQAEEVLKEALKKNPNNIPVKLKLLSIYVTRKDTNSFYTYAREIKESGDKSAWDQTVAMGRELDPTNPLYGGDASAAAAAPAAENKASPVAQASGAAPSVDFDLGFGSSSANVKTEFSGQKTVTLEEPPSTEKTTVMSAEALHSASNATPMDFDITGTNPGIPSVNFVGDKLDQTQTLNMDDLVFDVTATHPGVNIPAQAEPVAQENNMAFTLDFPTESQVKVAPTRSLGLDEITLNLDKTGSSTVVGGTPTKDELWQEVATKLDLAKAYQEMGDVAGAREILDEVLRDGDAQQRESAQTLMQQLL